MDRRELKRKLRALEVMGYDPERAHTLEDEIRHDVLVEIAHGELTLEEARRLATMALRTSDVEFARCYCE